MEVAISKSLGWALLCAAATLAFAGCGNKNDAVTRAEKKDVVAGVPVPSLAEANSIAEEGFIYGNSAIEAMYPQTIVTATGERIDTGKRGYTLTFAKGALPPGEGKWNPPGVASQKRCAPERLDSAYRLSAPGLGVLRADEPVDSLRKEPQFRNIERKHAFPN